MNDRDWDEGLTAQDHEQRAWQPSEVILIGMGLVVMFAILVFACAGFPWLGGGGIIGF